MKNYAIKTPHAAVLIWNYDDRFGSEGSSSNDKIEQLIISTISCKSISTSKSKSDPQGSFRIELAPTKNWVSTITAGSWCVVLMTNEKIEEGDIFEKADHRKVKMFGKIESVRVSTTVGAEGQRTTSYTIIGVDWGHIFNSKLYIDNRIIADAPQDFTHPLMQQLNGANIDSKTNKPLFRTVRELISQLLYISGKPLKIQAAANDAGVNRLASAVYTQRLPKEVINYFQFIRTVAGSQPSKEKKQRKSLKTQRIESSNANIADVISVITGTLVSKDTYNNGSEAGGYINAFSLQGVHTLWQVLIEHSNPPLNEMIAEIRWEEYVSAGSKKIGPKLVLYNRRKPFSLKDSSSLFKNVRHHDLDPVEVISIETGTNWRDKYNFVELRLITSEPEFIKLWTLSKNQQKDTVAFSREGFRPMMPETTQVPIKQTRETGKVSNAPDWDQIGTWSSLLKQWYFDTHRMLNGTITLVGVDEYIAVGDNIRFDAALINPTANLNKGQVKKGTTDGTYVLAHVENISHSFNIEQNGSRSFITAIQFVRGILVDGSNELLQEGKLDRRPSDIPPTKEINSRNTFGMSDSSDPDPDKLKGK